MTPGEAKRRFREMLDEAGLPRYDRARHRRNLQSLELSWDHGLTIHIDLTCHELEPLDDEERLAILGLPPWQADAEPIHITVPGSANDPRTEPSIPGVVIHRVPELHPDDVTVIDGLPVTSPSRTLIDCAECMDEDELRETFARARDRGLLDQAALRASRERVEWRPSLAMLDEIIAEFCD
jgi:hypothetical protein